MAAPRACASAEASSAGAAGGGGQGALAGEHFDGLEPLLDFSEYKRQAMTAMFKERVFLSRTPAEDIDTRPCRKWVKGRSKNGIGAWLLANPKAKAALRSPGRKSGSQGGLGHDWKLAGMSLQEVSKRMMNFEQYDADLNFLVNGESCQEQKRKQAAKPRGGCVYVSDASSDSGSGQEDGREPDAKAEVVSLDGEEDASDFADRAPRVKEEAWDSLVAISDSSEDCATPRRKIRQPSCSVAEAAAPAQAAATGDHGGQRFAAAGDMGGQLRTPPRGSQGAGGDAASAEKPAPPTAQEKAPLPGAKAEDVDIDPVDVPDWPM